MSKWREAVSEFAIKPHIPKSQINSIGHLQPLKLVHMEMRNKIIAFLNLIAFLASIAIIVAGIWLAQNPDIECISNFRWPLGILFILGILGFLVILVVILSCAGFFRACSNKEGIPDLYLFLMALLIGLLLFLLIFASVVNGPDGSNHVAGRAYDESRLDGFSAWLSNYITTSGHWANVRSCLAESDVCATHAQQYITADQFFNSHLSPLQSGCCKPPTVCGYSYMNRIMWVNPANPTADPDCYLWSNDPNQLCYNCNACKAGLLGNLSKEWMKAKIILIVVVVLLILVWVITCIAVKTDFHPT